MDIKKIITYDDLLKIYLDDVINWQINKLGLEKSFDKLFQALLKEKERGKKNDTFI